jgi:hypothetical protein
MDGTETPKAERIILPEDSDYWIRKNADDTFSIGARGSTTPCIEDLDAQSGRVVYTALRGQDRIEHSKSTKRTLLQRIAPNTFDKRPLQVAKVNDGRAMKMITHTHPGRTDDIPRLLSKDFDCTKTAAAFIEHAGLKQALLGERLENPTLEDLRKKLQAGPFPQLVYVGAQYAVVRDAKAGTPAYEAKKRNTVHVFIALGYDRGRDEVIGFEKVIQSLPWRLAGLKGMYDMYNEDFRKYWRADDFTWTIYDLIPERSASKQN